MSSESASNRERLLELDPPRGAARAQYEQALQQLFEQRLSRFERLRYVLLAAAGAIMALGLGSLALTEPATTPAATRIALGVLAAMGATWFLVAWRLVRRGSVHLVADRRRIAGIVFLFAVLQCGFFAWISWQRTDALTGLFVGGVMLVIAGVGYVVQHVREAELRTREQILRAALAGLSA